MKKLQKYILNKLEQDGKLEFSIYESKLDKAAAALASYNMVKYSQRGNKVVVEKLS